MKRAARLVALAGAAALGLFLCRSSAREIVLVYDLGDVRDARDLRVRVERGAEVLRRAEFPSPRGQVHHTLKLPDGTYRVHYALDRPGGSLSGERDLRISESQTIVLSLAP